MYKNQLQELAQRSCFNLPGYTCIREGPDHAPRFKAVVSFNGETYESPNYCTTLRQAEHSAAEVALIQLTASHAPPSSLAARILDETGVYKNLLQEVSQRVGASLPTYTTLRSGPGHLPVFTCTVELAGCTFTGESAKNKKQAEKNAAMSAWSSLKLLTQQSESLPLQKGNTEEQEHVIVARALQKFRLKARMSNIPFPIRFPAPKPKTLVAQPPPSTTSKILPLFFPKKSHNRHRLTTLCTKTPQSDRTPTSELPLSQSAESSALSHQHKFPAVGAAPYIPVRHLRPHHGMAPPVTIRSSIPVFSAPPLPPAGTGIASPPYNHFAPQFGRPPSMCSGVAPPVTIRQAVPVFSASEAPTKPITRCIPPQIEVKENTSSHEDSKSSIMPSAMPSLTQEDEEGSHALATSISPLISSQTVENEVSGSVEPRLKELQI